MQTLKELCDQHAPLSWRRALAIGRSLVAHRFVGTPALVSDAIWVDGDQVQVATMPEPEQPPSGDLGDEHGWARDSAVQLWKNMQDRAAVLVRRDRIVTYMSPEQLLGKPLDEASHVYSIGVIVYELLTGRVPFADAKGVAGLITAQLKREPAPPSTHAPVPPDVDALVLCCLQKRRGDRFSGLDALANAIDEQLASPSR